VGSPGTPVEHTQQEVREDAAPRRLLFIDNLRWSMIILVLSMHASDTYSPFGGWYYTDRPPLSQGELIFFATWQSFLQGFFMALLFFVAACFTPASYDRKGPASFLRDRFIRLMVPTLLYVFAIGPLTEYYVSRSWTGGGGFVRQWLEHLIDGEWMSGTGPMWFCVVLFGFSLFYAGGRWVRDRLGAGRPPAIKASISPTECVAFILTMAVLAFVVRIVVRSDRSILNVHPGDLPQYFLTFAAGILLARGTWLEDGLARGAPVLAVGSLASAAGLWIFMVEWGSRFPADVARMSGGFNPLSALKCLWEALVCVGMSLLLLGLYRRRFDSQGPLARLLSENAFAVYLFHPPILIVIAILMHGFSAPGPWKAALLTVLAAVASFSLCHLVLRQVPYLRRVL